MTWTLGRDIPALLDDRFPLPVDRPFTAGQAAEVGVSRSALGRLLREGLLRRVLRGVYVAAQSPDDLLVRAQALQLAVPDHAVVTDWTACWLHTGVLPPGDHLAVPPVSVFRFPGRGRLRNGLARSGERSFDPQDLMVIEGVTVTTPLRTALDLGRFAPRDWAIAGIDVLLRTAAFDRSRLLDDVERFRGQRGVVQLRELAPVADGRAESPGESVLRLRWVDLSHLPPPQLQIPVIVAGVERYRIDLGLEELQFGVEYDGEEYHSSDAARAHDLARRRNLRDNHGWLIAPVTKLNVFGTSRDVERIIEEGVREARRRRGRFRR